MTKSELPELIVCPVCRHIGRPDSITTSETPLSVAQFFDESTECYSPYIAPYTCENNHTIYIDYNDTI